MHDRKTDRKYVALVAHNEMKPTMMAFIAANLAFFERSRIITTGSTGTALEAKFGLNVEKKVSSGPLGGDQEIGCAVACGEVAAIFFFRDPLSVHPHEADVQALSRLADVHDVAMASNLQTAKALVYALVNHHAIHTDLRPGQRARAATDRVLHYKSGQSTVLKSLAGGHTGMTPSSPV